MKPKTIHIIWFWVSLAVAIGDMGLAVITQYPGFLIFSLCWIFVAYWHNHAIEVLEKKP